jgi:beta-1,4-mannosyltransferase
MLTPHPYIVKAGEGVQVDRKNRVRKRSQEKVLQVLMSPGPDKLTDNPSLLLLFSEVVRHGVTISSCARKKNLLSRPDVIHIHFPEWLIRWKRPWLAPLDVVVILGLLWLARRRGAALVWTGHDLEPHELSRPRLWRAYNRFFISQVDLLISFSEGAKSLLVERHSRLAGVPTVVVPHGHYRDHYTAPPKAAILRKELKLDHRPVLLCFGLIRPYKNLPGIICAWRQLPEPRPQLLIAGRPMDSEIAEVIKKEAGEAKDVHLLLRFIHGDEVPTIFALADVVLMPYMARSALNSGVAHLALSLSRPAVLNDTLANQNLRDVFGGEWVWLCDGTPADALRTALVAAATTRPETLDLDVINYKRLAAETRCAYSDAIARRGKRSNH